MDLDPSKLPPELREELEELLRADTAVWRPQPGPQKQAYESLADIVGYGGAAGGGKTDLAIGLALTRHRRVGIFRENGTELLAIQDRIATLLGGRDGFNGRDNVWRATRTDGAPVQIEFGSFPNVGDEVKQQGRARDLIVFDEAGNMREAVVRYVLAWLRSVDPRQRCRALLTFNPPTTVEGRWLVQFFAPWIDRQHPHPAKPGELRYFAVVDGRDVEVETRDTFVHGGERIQPLSRTFIPSRVSDNPYLATTGYVAQLQSLPEPLRSQMLHGDFAAGMEDSPWQVVPTAWVEAAMARWHPPEPDRLPPMDSLGVDVARGGRDSTIIARRHGNWFDIPLVYPGGSTPNGQAVAGLAIAAVRDGAAIHVDVIGVGAAPYDFLSEQDQHVIGVNVSESPTAPDKSGRLKFKNRRSQLWWAMREALDPANNSSAALSAAPRVVYEPGAPLWFRTGIALPPDRRLFADLTAPTWKLSGQTIQVASREEIQARIGRSPDFGSAYVLAQIDTPRRAAPGDPFVAARQRRHLRDYDPYAEFHGGLPLHHRGEQHDPYRDLQN